MNIKILQIDLFAARADEAGSPSLEDGVLVGWRTLVVLLAPDEVPGGGEKDYGGKNHRCVVHRDGRDRQEGRHAEEGSCESRPSYVILLALHDKVINVDRTYQEQQCCRTVQASLDRIGPRQLACDHPVKSKRSAQRS